ncbi:phage holin family protein [Gordonia shandongensis]|uniref:phage holin family protein n=1 Tax=Gordonia shandongensis TaxID=376351 RepID=UPI0003F5656B|nr:phage holin family protein [Gordonia shandongensis]
MRAFLVRTALTGLALWVAASIPGIGVYFHFGGVESWWGKTGIVLATAAVFGVVNAVVKPVVQVLSIPLYILSLGLVHIVINALMLSITSWATNTVFDHGLVIDDFFWSAILGAIVVSVVGWLTAILMRDRLENLYQ